jgi:dephospho-CoA kinase
MYKVLVTGGIGSGKTTACKMFEELGVPVFYSDQAAKRIMDSNKEIIDKVDKEFPGVYENGVLDRKKLAAIVFNDPDRLETLNDMVHPAVGEAFDSFVEINEVFKESEYVIEEAAIAIELGIQDRFDYIVVITADEEIRIERTMKRDNCTEEQVRERMDNQLPEKKRLSYADSIIGNNDFDGLETQVKLMHEKILKKIQAI